MIIAALQYSNKEDPICFNRAELVKVCAASISMV